MDRFLTSLGRKLVEKERKTEGKKRKKKEKKKGTLHIDTNGFRSKRPLPALLTRGGEQIPLLVSFHLAPLPCALLLKLMENGKNSCETGTCLARPLRQAYHYPSIR